MSAKPKTLCQQKIENPDISLARFGRDISLCRWRHKKRYGYESGPQKIER